MLVCLGNHRLILPAALLDGNLGTTLARGLEAVSVYRALGFWDNGLRHLSNRLRPVRSPADIEGLRLRLQPNAWHERFSARWGRSRYLCT